MRPCADRFAVTAAARQFEPHHVSGVERELLLGAHRLTVHEEPSRRAGLPAEQALGCVRQPAGDGVL